ncbi:MAG: outer membrane beta-barrel protein, partial [Ekhidna sp.]
MMKKLFTLIVLTIAFGAATAQTAENRFSIPINVTLNHYDGALGNEIFKLKRASAGFETGLKYYLNPSFNLAGNFSAFRLGYDAFKIDAQDFDLSLEYKFNNGNILDEDSRWKPFITAGLGFIHDIHFEDQNNYFSIPFGAGVRYQFSEVVDGLVQTRYKATTDKDVTNYLTTSIGLV